MAKKKNTESEAETIEPGTEEGPGKKKPCIALMGEFSAGKSTLSNLLIGAQSLPVQVTATQLPPVWIAHGDKAPFRVDVEGNVQPVDLKKLNEVSVDDTSYVRIYRDSKVLEMCDIIDMPGISDPSMAATVWQRVIHHATAVIWCTHATQAWRQSEAAVWESLPPDLYDKSFLLLTRADKISNDNDRARLQRRVMKETQGLFAEVMPISLTQALDAGDDRDAWVASGAAHFTEKLEELVARLSGETPARPTATARPAPALGPAPEPLELVDPIELPGGSASIVPRRVTPRAGGSARPRPSARPSARAMHAR
ncbi:MAG: dynamin family protein [Pseudomonadota bacterium]